MLDANRIFPEPELPDGRALLAEGRALARDWQVGPCPFLTEHGVASEAEHKRRAMADGRITHHAQIGYRELEKSCRAYREIHAAVAAAGFDVDRYGICLDWSMGYTAAMRGEMGRGTGLVMRGPEDFVTLTGQAPVAPHFGDFVMGFPAAVENTQAALAAGATAIGNLGQYFTFRMPHVDDDVGTTAETVKALGLCAAQPVEVIIHSNIDDGFAAHFADLACCLGSVLLERHVVESLVGGRIGFCFGHHFSEPLTRLAFQRALAIAVEPPGTMVYGNTVAYRSTQGGNFASLASYLLVDVIGQRTRPTGHAVNAVPVTENERIPDIDEVIDAQVFAGRLCEHAGDWSALVDVERADAVAAEIVAGGRTFRDRVLTGLAAGGVDVDDPLQVLLAMRRVGAKRLEELYGPGAPAPERPRGRAPVVPATTLVELERSAARYLGAVPTPVRARIASTGIRVCIATTDVHEHGKTLLEQVLAPLGVDLVDAGTSVDPDDLATLAAEKRVDLIALSTYNGVALRYVEALKRELATRGLEVPVLVGGRLNQIPDGSNSSLPVDVTAELARAGAVPCTGVEAMIEILGRMGGDAAEPAAASPHHDTTSAGPAP
ncbi:MAG: cobalamin B12-binding domain-containing protein [Ectothiorhodospiraceae bacterium]|nr:cobalamin B12-binding domain-containing protein [Ectothiorhodospiraceae bacterium]